MKPLTPLARFARSLRRIAMSTVTRNAERPVLMAVAKAAAEADETTARTTSTARRPSRSRL